jgi:uncharacterized protein HemX
MVDRPTDGGTIPEDRDKNHEIALGGADAVEKTTSVTGQGAEPAGRRAGDAPATRVPAGSGQGATWAVLAFLAIGAVLVYLLGFGR